MSSHTIVVRDYAIDTPELPKNGLPGQKYSQEAKNFAKSKLLDKKVRVQCLGKDQYGRLIGKVMMSSSLNYYYNDCLIIILY